MKHVTHESRWFVEIATMPRVDVDMARPRRRVDLYDIESLTPSSSRKLRGGRIVEVKRRVGEPHVVAFDGGEARFEPWIKECHKGGSVRRKPTPDAEAVRWVAVRKEIWRSDSFELTRVGLGAGHWWSIAIDLDQVRRACRDHRLLAWWDALATAPCVPYSSWLIDALHTQQLAEHSDRCTGAGDG